eukprot:m.41135 g.41135  ORF g.41135 m.41135 type:complete len:317 (-) comp6030_c0_seq2:143-1093(-)
MRVLRTAGVHGHAVEVSPFHPHRIACAAAQHYGLAGAGELVVFDAPPAGEPRVCARLERPEGLYDLAWSETHENHIATAAADGRMQLWDIGLRLRGPLRVFHEHAAEVYSIAWSYDTAAPRLLTGSWDCTVKLWDPEVSTAALRTYAEHLAFVYCAVWAPRAAGLALSASGDRTLKIIDMRLPNAAATIRAHDYEVLTCDWSKYDANLVFSGSVDRTIRAFDIRAVRHKSAPLLQLEGHTFGVRRLKTSPHSPNLLASASYDFTTRLWDTDRPPMEQEVAQFGEHSEFCVGLDFSLHDPHLLIDCGWDERVHLYDI